MKTIIAKPLTAQDFAPFGDVLDMPKVPSRVYFQEALGNLRPHACASISTTFKEPSPAMPFQVNVLERHAFSSQSFMPAEVSVWMLVVAPHDAQGQPDLERVQAFLANDTQGITYKPDVWHHGLTVFETPGKFNIFMWRDNTSDDEEFVTVPPFLVTQA